MDLERIASQLEEEEDDFNDFLSEIQATDDRINEERTLYNVNEERKNRKRNYAALNEENETQNTKDDANPNKKLKTNDHDDPFEPEHPNSNDEMIQNKETTSNDNIELVASATTIAINKKNERLVFGQDEFEDSELLEKEESPQNEIHKHKVSTSGIGVEMDEIDGVKCLYIPRLNGYSFKRWKQFGDIRALIPEPAIPPIEMSSLNDTYRFDELVASTPTIAINKKRNNESANETLKKTCDQQQNMIESFRTNETQFENKIRTLTDELKKTKEELKTKKEELTEFTRKCNAASEFINAQVRRNQSIQVNAKKRGDELATIKAVIDQ